MAVYNFEIWNIGDSIFKVFRVHFRQCKHEPGNHWVEPIEHPPLICPSRKFYEGPFSRRRWKNSRRRLSWAADRLVFSKLTRICVVDYKTNSCMKKTEGGLIQEIQLLSFWWVDLWWMGADRCIGRQMGSRHIVLSLFSNRVHHLSAAAEEKARRRGGSTEKRSDGSENHENVSSTHLTAYLPWIW